MMNKTDPFIKLWLENRSNLNYINNQFDLLKSIELQCKLWQRASILFKKLKAFDESFYCLFEHLINSVYRLILRPDWNLNNNDNKNDSESNKIIIVKRREILKKNIEDSLLLLKNDGNLPDKIIYLLRIYDKPWQYDYIPNIIYQIDIDAERENLCLNREGNQLAVMRLIELCDLDCHDYALNWSETSIRVMLSTTSTIDKKLEPYLHQLQFIHWILLLKYNRLNELGKLIGTTPFTSIILILNSNLKNWSYYTGNGILLNLQEYKIKLTKILLKIVIQNELKRELNEKNDKDNFIGYLIHWIKINQDDMKFLEMIRVFIERSTTSSHLFLMYNALECCQVIYINLLNWLFIYSVCCFF